MNIHSPRGFALLEALVALAIIAMVGASSLALVGQQDRAAMAIPPAIFATELARSRLASIELQGRATLLNLPDSLSAGVTFANGKEWFWRAFADPLDPLPGLFELVVRVSDGSSQIEVHTFVYRPARSGHAQ